MHSSAPLTRVQQLLPELFKSEQRHGESYLRFLIAPEAPAMLAIVQVHETLVAAIEQITPVPNLPEWTVGLMASRNAVFSVIDLAQFLGLPMAIATHHCHIIVIQTQLNAETVFLGLMVNRIQGLLRVMTEDIESPIGAFPDGFTPYLQGCLAVEGEQLMVLDARAIAYALTQFTS